LEQGRLGLHELLAVRARLNEKAILLDVVGRMQENMKMFKVAVPTGPKTEL